ncbi:Cytochrome P450 monooxygenase COX2 [Psilocybe cubensis]|uniref:Cytochrome P450 monooxygenase COX2 n=1 Tax=Psilocybe cubensis TaxID=181762 RepID=A0ACB8GRA6_PSICU|nr:Cytochrome P450 monooxygenase COX2 [Psilocybe cubensis]KAH9478005.1 Cytochrome P450 monooxygenase COX2 [Psilocybe cubensis]
MPLVELLSTAFERLSAYPLLTSSAVALGYVLTVKAVVDKSRKRKRNPKNLPPPPGPKGYPIIGNLFDVPHPADSPHIIREVRGFLRRLQQSPENFMHHVRHTFAAIIMGITYGITVEDTSDPYISNAEEALQGLVETAIPGSYLVDLIPALLYIPSWFPGASFKRKAAYWSRLNNDVINKPFEYIENELTNDREVVPSVTTSLISRLPEKDDPLYSEERQIAKHATSVAYIVTLTADSYLGPAGADTTVSTVQTLFLAMAMYPEALKKAHAELDAVVGPYRLPDYGDCDSLPYINAIVKESMRWNQVLPLAIAHMTTHDDEYDGYFIPRGTVVMPNGWSILHDPEVFPDPMEFKPERYLKDGKLDHTVRSPECAAFGFGRRICPGRHLSDNSLYLIVASTLAVYDIKPAIDEFGNPIKLEAKFTSGFIS